MGIIASRKMAIFVILIHTLAYAIWLLACNNDWLRIIGSDLFQTTAPIIAAYWLYRRYQQVKTRDRIFWLFLSFSMVSYTLGMVVWMYYDIYLRITPPFPGTCDIFWILMRVFIFVAFNFLLTNSSISKIFKLVYDTLIIISIASSISWAFIVKPILDVSKEHSVLSQLIYASSTILNLAILLGLLFIFNSKNFK
ncbi:MAG: hypothetical protein Q8934_19900, partial [Bacillota bacterium]|nr:hypothetical protein [Bacillota bacterium]